MFEVIGWIVVRSLGYGWLWRREEYAAYKRAIDSGEEPEIFGNGGNLLPIGLAASIAIIAGAMWLCSL